MLKCICAHTVSYIFCTDLLQVLGMLILCGLLSRRIVGKVCTCYLSLCSIFLSHNILFVAPDLVLLLFHFQFLLLLLLLLLLLIIIIIIITINNIFVAANNEQKNGCNHEKQEKNPFIQHSSVYATVVLHDCIFGS